MDQSAQINNGFWRRELSVACLAIGAGFFVLPFAIYWVGRQVFGEYGRGGGNVLDLAEGIWSDFFKLFPAAWLLVLSPYLTLLLLRLLRGIWRSRVTAVTESHAER
jgi:hypothetical protein